MKFTKGKTYLVKGKGSFLWYIVHQISQRGWVATAFTHPSSGLGDMELWSRNGNGIHLWEELDVEEFVSFNNNQVKDLRKTMMSILKYGTPSRTGEV